MTLLSTLMHYLPEMDRSVFPAYCYKGSFVGTDHADIDLVEVFDADLGGCPFSR